MAAFNEALVGLARRSSFARGELVGAIRDITEVAAHALRVERAGVWVFDQARTKIVCADLFERSKGRHSRGDELSARDYPSYFAALEDARMIPASDAGADPRTREFAASYLRPLRIASMLDAPIREGGRLVGVACHEHIGPHREWTPAEQAFAASIADFAALAFERGALLESEEKLRAEMRERERTEDKLRQALKLEAIGRLAGGVAHDFNNLLTAMLGHAELLLEALAEGEQREAAVEIRDAAKRAAALTQQLLAFGRRQARNPRVLDLRGVVGDLAPILRRLLGEKHELVVRERATAGRVRADSAQIDQILLNLVMNSRDAMPGGGSIEIEIGDASDDEVAVAFHAERPRQGCVMLAVRDAGNGMDAETRARLFEPFFTTKKPGRGTGLGLATVYGIVQQSGGAISVKSEPGVGTAFEVLFPRVADEASREPALPSVPAGGGETILVVDDDGGVRAVARASLAAYGYLVLCADSGEAALRLARNHPGPVDLLITDVVMPGMDGPELAATVGRERPGLRVLFMSGYPDRRAPADEADACLAKPFTPTELARAVQQALARKRSQEA